MNSRTVCRVCKTEGVRLHCITDSHLQEMYEIETHTLLTTDDNKPLVACIECCDRLQHFYQMRNGIEQGKNTPTMMNLDSQLQIDKNDIHQNNTCVVKIGAEKCVKMEPEQLSDVEIKQENTTDTTDETLQDKDIILEEKHQLSDTDLGIVPTVINIKSEALSVYEDEDETNGIITSLGENSRGALSENSEDISRKQKINDESDNCAETSRVNISYPDKCEWSAILNNYEWDSKQNHTQSTFECKGSSQNELVKHTSLHKRFSSKMLVVNHARTHTAERTYECEMCKKCFRQKGHLDRHSRMHTDERPFECDVCKKCFRQKKSLEHHCLIHINKKPFQCDICKKCFRQKVHLKIHSGTHTGEKPFECKVCKKCFRQKKSLENHSFVHVDVKPFECDICKKCFSLKIHLEMHSRTHSGDARFKCNTCLKGFQTKNNLLQHIRIHTDEKSFECDICKKRFTIKRYLLRHRRTHTGGDKPFECDKCKKCFKLQVDLIMHSRSHNGEKPFECHTCKKCFTTKLYLRSHIRSHTSEKPFKCNQCQKCFSVKYRLERHSNIHTGERPFECDVCQKCFSQKSTLVRHRALHLENGFIVI